MRLDKYLGQSGVATRSEATKFIRARRVTVDGVVVRDPAQHIDPDTASVMLFFFGCRIGIRSRLRPRSGSALTATGSHSLPTRSNPFQLKQKTKTDTGWCLFFFGCRIGIRTPTNRVRVCRATVTQFGIALQR